MATHNFSSEIELIQNLDSAAVVNDSNEYFDHLQYKPTIGKDVRRMAVFTDKATAEAMGNTAGLLGTSRSHFAGYCILVSICTSDLLPEKAKISLQKYTTRFEKGVELFKNMATTLT
jgi:hypothetical protein